MDLVDSLSSDTEIGILASFVITIIFWGAKPDLITNYFKSYSVVSYMKKKQLRNTFRIAIVDDEMDSYPVDYIRKLNFEVKEYSSVSFADAEQLTKNDLLLLDVKGVVKEDLDEGGAKLIKIIKELRPLLPVVSVSSGVFHTELNDYFRISDDTIKKPVDEFKITEQLNELKKEFFDVDSIASSIENTIRDLELSDAKKRKLNKFIIDFISRQCVEKNFIKFVHQNALDKSSVIIHNSNILRDRVDNA